MGGFTCITIVYAEYLFGCGYNSVIELSNMTPEQMKQRYADVINE